MSFVIVIALLAVWSIAASVVLPAWGLDARREREQEFVRIGRAYAEALARYRRASPGGGQELPRDLAELLVDRRFPSTVRYLRRLYPDPVNNHRPWVVVRNMQGRITGVRSGSEQEAVMVRTGSGGRVGVGTNRYADWVFSVEELP